MKLSLIALSLMALVGIVSCSNTTTFKGAEPIVIKATPPTVVDKQGFTVTLPARWKIKKGLEGQTAGPFTMQMAAKSDDDNPIAVVVVSVNLDNDDDDGPGEEEFPIVAVAFASENLGSVDKATLTVRDGLPTSLAVVSVEKKVKVLQLATASKRIGYIFRCGGEVGTPHLGETCVSIANSFHVKK